MRVCIGTQTIFLVSFVIMATGGVVYGAAAVRNPSLPADTASTASTASLAASQRNDTQACI